MDTSCLRWTKVKLSLLCEQLVGLEKVLELTLHISDVCGADQGIFEIYNSFYLLLHIFFS